MASAAFTSPGTTGVAAIADRWPERLGSLTMLSRPHPLAFSRALREDPEQPARSAHHKWPLDPSAEDKVLADDAH